MEYLKGVKLVYASNWWDGPLSGLVEYNDENLFMDINDEEWTYDDEGLITESRIYAVYRLNARQLRDYLMWTQLFRSHVGEHWDFHLNEGPALWGGFVHPDTFDTFYFISQMQPMLDYDDDQLIGYVHEDDLDRQGGRGNDRIVRMSEVDVCPLHHKQRPYSFSDRVSPVVEGHCPTCNEEYGDPYFWTSQIKCRIHNDLESKEEHDEDVDMKN